jgi:hypothetical protein
MLFSAVLLQELRGIPMFDDFQALILFAVNFLTVHGLTPKLLYAISAQHDEYKLIFEHLLVALQLTLSPHLHYRFLAILGNLFVLATLAVYWVGYFSDMPLDRRLLRFAPISFLLVQLNYVETLDWAMCGLQMIPVIFFTVLSLYLVATPRLDDRWRFTLGCISASLACLASANGFVLGPVGLLLLLQQKAFRRMIGWCVSFTLALAAYLYRYQPITREALVHPTILQKLEFFLTYLGGAVENMHHFPVHGAAMALGMVILLTWLYSLRVGYHRTHPFAFYAALWILLCSAGVTQVRSKLGFDLSLSLRYKIYSDMLMIFVYGFAVHRIDAQAAIQSTRWNPVRRRNIYAVGLLFVFLLNLSSALFGYKALKHRADTCAEAFRIYRADPQHASPEVSLTADPITSGEPEFSRKVMNEAIAKGIFIAPANP